VKNLHLLVALALSGCVRNPSPPVVSSGGETTIAFPDLARGDARRVGEEGAAHILDGVTLRALQLAAQDFLPPGPEDRPCWRRPEAYDYRVLRQGNVIFVHIHMAPGRCGREFLAFDSGAKYAISTEGRILRRAFEGEPEAPFIPPSPAAGEQERTEKPGLSTIIKRPQDEPSLYLPPAWLEGGVSPDGGSAPMLDGGP
jgi:hypothetical protein